MIDFHVTVATLINLLIVYLGRKRNTKKEQNIIMAVNYWALFLTPVAFSWIHDLNQFLI